MTLKSAVLAGATLVALAAPAAAMAQPNWDHDRGYHDGYRDRAEWRSDWRRHAWYAHSEFGRRCFVENRGYHAWNGRYVSRPVEVCR